MLISGDAGLNFYNGNNGRASGLPARLSGLRDVPQSRRVTRAGSPSVRWATG